MVPWSVGGKVCGEVESFGIFRFAGFRFIPKPVEIFKGNFLGRQALGAKRCFDMVESFCEALDAGTGGVLGVYSQLS